MKILLSAYACEPNKGSEPGVGWNWAMELSARGHQVWVITRSNNKASIETELAKFPPKNNLHFIYCDLPKWMTFWKKGSRGVQLYYVVWQWHASRMAKNKHQKIQFDRVHHVTFSDIRSCSFMHNLEIPFIFGPVGGGNRAPWKLRNFGFRGQIADAIRDFANFLLLKVLPWQRQMMRKAHHIYVTSKDTLQFVPKDCWPKTSIQLEIGCDKNFQADGKIAFSQKSETTDIIKILYVGRFLYLKGMHLGLPAFSKLLQHVPNAHLTLIGNGPEEQLWHRYIQQHNLSKNVTCIPWAHRSELKKYYATHHLFLFPSLRDNSGNVILEAMSYGLPIICFDLGGPGIMVNNSCGRVLNVTGLTPEQTIEQLFKAMQELSNNPTLLKELAVGALNRINDFQWETLVSRIYAQNETTEYSPPEGMYS